MSESKELKMIKKKYGEKFMKLCREFFPTLLEKEGLLYEVLSSTFSENCKTLYEDIINTQLDEDFKNYIYSKIDVESPEKEIITDKTPYELLDEAGYILTECKTEKEIQNFKKYYKPNEKLCTFNGGRLDRCVVFFAVKKNAEDIKREDFETPKREDEYGTSVIGIQFNRYGLCTVSIKNRYNHTVNNPDATYGNDLDRITPGLAKSFAKLLKKEHELELNNTNVETFVIPGYTVANDGKYYKYNMEINGTYYCPGNVIIKNGQAIKLENPESQLLMDYFILDTKNKTISLYDSEIQDSFIEAFGDLSDAEIQIEKNREKGNGIKVIKITKNGSEPIIIEINKNNEIIGYTNPVLERVRDNFLCENKKLKNLDLPNLKQAGNNFLKNKLFLKELKLPNLEQVGAMFLYENIDLSNLEVPNLKKVGHHFLSKNIDLIELKLPKLEQAGYGFLNHNSMLTKLELPKLKEVNDDFLGWNDGLTELKLPNLERIGDKFLYTNENLVKLELPKLEQVGDSFLHRNYGLTKLEIPNLKKVGNEFLIKNMGLTELKVPRLEEVGDYFLFLNQDLTKIEADNLKEVGKAFLQSNRSLTKLKLPNLEQAEENFLFRNQVLKELELPNLKKVGSGFLPRNRDLTELKLPNLQQVGTNFLFENRYLAKLELPKLELARNYFLYGNRALRDLELPNLIKVGNDFLAKNRCLIEAKLPNLEQVGHSFLSGNRDLTKLELPKLKEAGDSFLENNLDLTELRLPVLEKVVELGFLSRNKRLKVLELPKLPELEEEILYNINWNLKEEFNEVEISSQNIASLDKKSELTTTEASVAKRTIEEIQDMSRKIDENERKK